MIAIMVLAADLGFAVLLPGRRRPLGLALPAQ
ncbi:hypothetical protein FHU14_001104 [Mesorhizobium sp. RMAD-H1]|nr:hypothetical protein [Mesorhizobium sp. RMAD-H1]